MKTKLLSLALAACMTYCMIPNAFAVNNEATNAADALYELGLFSGVGMNPDGTPIYDLERAPTRHEAVTMLVSLLGKKDEALNGTWEIPFTDVADWAKPFVGYAYANGLTSGTSATTFGGNDLVSAAQYLTFVLKTLGYEAGKDFQWNKAWELSDQLGITQGQYHTSSSFTRGDVAIISYNTLSANFKGGEQTLLDSLRPTDVPPVAPSDTPSEIPSEAPSDTSSETISDAMLQNAIQGCWGGEPRYKTSDTSVNTSWFFNGNEYGYALTVDQEGDMALAYENGTFEIKNGSLILTRNSSHIYPLTTGKDQITKEQKVFHSELDVTQAGDAICIDGVTHAKADEFGHFGTVKECVLARERVETISSADYISFAKQASSDLLSSDPTAVIHCAYVYVYHDLNGDLCVLTLIDYKNADGQNDHFTLYNVGKKTDIVNPDEYYASLTSDMDKRYSNEITGNQFNMLMAISNYHADGSNTFKGVFVDTAELTGTQSPDQSIEDAIQDAYWSNASSGQVNGNNVKVTRTYYFNGNEYICINSVDFVDEPGITLLLGYSEGTFAIENQKLILTCVKETSKFLYDAEVVLHDVDTEQNISEYDVKLVTQDGIDALYLDKVYYLNIDTDQGETLQSEMKRILF